MERAIKTFLQNCETFLTRFRDWLKSEHVLMEGLPDLLASDQGKMVVGLWTATKRISERLFRNFVSPDAVVSCLWFYLRAKLKFCSLERRCHHRTCKRSDAFENLCIFLPSNVTCSRKKMTARATNAFRLLNLLRTRATLLNWN